MFLVIFAHLCPAVVSLSIYLFIFLREKKGEKVIEVCTMNGIDMGFLYYHFDMEFSLIIFFICPFQV